MSQSPKDNIIDVKNVLNVLNLKTVPTKARQVWAAIKWKNKTQFQGESGEKLLEFNFPCSETLNHPVMLSSRTLHLKVKHHEQGLLHLLSNVALCPVCHQQYGPAATSDFESDFSCNQIHGGRYWIDGPGVVVTATS